MPKMLFCGWEIRNLPLRSLSRNSRNGHNCSPLPIPLLQMLIKNLMNSAPHYLFSVSLVQLGFRNTKECLTGLLMDWQMWKAKKRSALFSMAQLMIPLLRLTRIPGLYCFLLCLRPDAICSRIFCFYLSISVSPYCNHPLKTRSIQSGLLRFTGLL